MNEEQSDKLVLTIDAIKDFLSCRKLYDYRHYRRLTNGRLKSSRLLETVVRNSLKRLHGGEETSELLRNITSEFARQVKLGGIYSDMEEMAKIEELAKAMVSGYVREYPEDGQWMKKVEIERKFVVPIRNVVSGRKSSSLFFEVKPGFLYETGGKLFLLSWEITSRIGDNYKDWLRLNIKVPLLMYALREQTGRSLYGVNVRILRKSLPKENGKQSPLFEDITVLNLRDPSSVETLNELYWIAKDIWDCIRKMEEKAFYKNTYNCRYYGCEFARLCRSGGDIKEINKFQVREEG